VDIIKKTFMTQRGEVEGVQVKSACFSILLAGGSRGTLVCGVFDVEAMDGFNMPAAVVESSPSNPIGTLERFPGRKVVKANRKAQELGIREGMDVFQAFELIA
jgi:uncharacterized protein YunC (DUF1805 family)